MKKLLFLFSFFAALSAAAQTYSGNVLEAKQSLKVNGYKITAISNDTAFTAISPFRLPTQYAVYWFVTNRLNSLGFGSSTWGSIGGTLSAQTDLQTALNNKSNVGHTHTISNITDFPANVSYFSNDAGYLTYFTESDPVYIASVAHAITGTNISNWNTAYGWGNHASAGYLTSFTETDPVYIASVAHAITSTNVSNWNTAYGWGNHASAGYVPQARTITINGVAYDLGANRTWTISGLPTQAGNSGKYLTTDGTNASWGSVTAGVSSYNGRTGAVSPDVSDYSSYYAALTHTHSFASLTSKPTTVSGYGITDAATLTGTETLTNKTLTSPNLNSSSIVGQFWMATNTAGAGSWQTFTLPAFTPQTLTDASTVTWNYLNGYNATLTIGGNRTLSVTNASAGHYGTLAITQDATGGRTLTLPAGSKVLSYWGSGTTITLSTTPGAVDILCFVYIGGNYYWTIGKNYQ